MRVHGWSPAAVTARRGREGREARGAREARGGDEGTAHLSFDRRGFSLIEILIALAILSIGIMAVMRLFPMSLQQAQRAEERTIASELANARLGQVWTAGADRFFDGQLERSPSLTMPVDAMTWSHSIYERFDTTTHRMAGANDVFLQRVTFSVKMADGRYETFVTYVSQL